MNPFTTKTSSLSWSFVSSSSMFWYVTSEDAKSVSENLLWSRRPIPGQHFQQLLLAQKLSRQAQQHCEHSILSRRRHTPRIVHGVITSFHGHEQFRSKDC
ncbi:hypothetical protein CDAR_610321 [Caerostris darwini]|uniref:Uncharacterized protein n=1 Tax=Caerostris darwini TaxID=1538125 RepID=A0AAV4N6W6_9ARAC|nr:hypothetical protein CDAR_610321 [Caerostris darwini]